MWMYLTKHIKMCETKLIKLQCEIEKSITVGDLNTPLSVIDRSNREKISGERVDLKGTINQLDLMAFIEKSIQQHLTTHSSQAHMKYPPRQTTYWSLKCTLRNFKDGCNTKYVLTLQ